MTALAWAAGVKPDGQVRWRALEVAAFQDYPKVLRVLDPKSKYSSGGKRNPFITVLLAIGAFLLIIAFMFPSIVGFTTLVGDRFGRSHPDPHVTIPVAGVAFAVSVVTLVISIIPWVRGGRRKDGAAEVQALVASGLGAVSAVIAGTAGASEHVTGWQIWTGVIVLSTLVGFSYLVMLLVAHRSDSARKLKASLRGEKPDSTGKGKTGRAVEPLKPVRLAVERLPAKDQLAVRSDIDAAIDELASRNVISHDDAQWAHGADLGKLALRMSRPHA